MIIYKTINLINGKWYIGRDSNDNPNYLGSGKLLKRAIEKYGKENFKKEIIDTAKNIEDLKKKETNWIQKLNAHNCSCSYNIKSTGYDGISSVEWTNGMKEKAQERALRLSHKDRKSRVQKTKSWWSNGRRSMQSKIKKQQYKENPQLIEILRNAKLKSIETDPTQVDRQKQSLLNYYKDKKNRRKNSISRGGREFVALLNNRVIWRGFSQGLCAETLGLQQPNINKCLKGLRKSHKGYIFRYCDGRR